MKLSVMKIAVMVAMVLGMGVETAPTERDHLSPSSAAPEKPSALNLKQHLKQLLLSPKAGGEDRSAKKTTAGTITAGRPRTGPENPGPDKRAQMMKMILGLEELHRTLNGTLGSQITFLTRANGRTSGRKSKVPPPADGGPRSTTAPPTAANSTVSRASADADVPSLTGRNSKKSLTPQTKKTNKRVCFWKYCSQN